MPWPFPQKNSKTNRKLGTEPRDRGRKHFWDSKCLGFRFNQHRRLQNEPRHSSLNPFEIKPFQKSLKYELKIKRNEKTPQPTKASRLSIDKSMDLKLPSLPRTSIHVQTEQSTQNNCPQTSFRAYQKKQQQTIQASSKRYSNIQPKLIEKATQKHINSIRYSPTFMCSFQNCAMWDQSLDA